MSHKTLIRNENLVPSTLTELFKPWNEWFDDNHWPKTNVPAINVSENEKEYMLAVASPGLKKEDFKISIDGNILSISAERENNKEEKNEKYTRKEYNYSSFSRSFTLPGEVINDKIEAGYENGILKIHLPKNEKAKSKNAKSIKVK